MNQPSYQTHRGRPMNHRSYYSHDDVQKAHGQTEQNLIEVQRKLEEISNRLQKLQTK